MRVRSACSVLILAGAALGCGGNEVRDPSWSYISAIIIQPNCATSSCHSSAAAVAGLNLSTAEDGLRSLTTLHLPTRPAAEGMPAVTPARNIVLRGNPDESRLVNMLRARGARRMPPDRPLAEADIQLIEQWILLGALDN